MKSSLKASSKQTIPDEPIESNVEEFVPYACHFDQKTLLTKNGELLQIIKITGFSFETIDQSGEHLTLRKTIRKAIYESVDDTKFAFWLHTVRRKRNLETEGDYTVDFCKTLNRQWIEKNDLTHQYMNEVYISILIQGEMEEVRDVANFLRCLNIPSKQRHKFDTLDEAHLALSRTTGKILAVLERFGARQLSLVKHDGIYYSELLGFLNKIINLSSVPAPVGGVDLSRILPSHKILFRRNTLEVVGDTGHHYGVMLTIKEYHEVASEHIDSFLQLPMEFIVTETFDFVNAESAFNYFKRQYDIIKYSKDEMVYKDSGLADIYESNEGSVKDFGEHQITIMLLDDNPPSLEEELRKVVKSFKSLGVPLVREDVYMENCYWSQLPGNFAFIKRMTPINTKKLGGFASLYNFPAGKMNHNHWGPAVTMFYTASRTPYFFNFHYENNGHTFIIGPYHSGKKVLKNFLISEAQKYRPRLFYFDHSNGGEIFIRAAEGSYVSFRKDPSQHEFKLNPFLLPNTPENKGFLYNLMAFTLTKGSRALDPVDDQKIRQLIDYNYKLPAEKRLPRNLFPVFWPYDRSTAPKPKRAEELSAEELARSFVGEDKPVVERTTAEIFADWYDSGPYAHYFDNEADDWGRYSASWFGMDVTALIKSGEPVIPVMFYLMHRVYQSLDDKPTIIAIDEAWSLLDNPVFAQRMDLWLDLVRQRNGLVIFASENIKDVAKSNLTKRLKHLAITQIFMPNPEADDSYQDIFGLTEKEVKALKKLSKEKRQFLLKHYGESVIGELNLAGLDQEIKILSASGDSIALMNGAMLDSGPAPSQWLALFKERLGA